MKKVVEVVEVGTMTIINVKVSMYVKNNKIIICTIDGTCSTYLYCKGIRRRRYLCGPSSGTCCIKVQAKSSDESF